MLVLALLSLKLNFNGLVLVLITNIDLGGSFSSSFLAKTMSITLNGL